MLRLGGMFRDHSLASFASGLIFVIALMWFYNYTGVFERLPERPCSVHVSAFTQRASIAQNYANIDMNFFKPRFNSFETSMGISGSEFPILYYLAAICYKLFGFNDMYLKIIHLLVFSIGVFFFFRLAQQFLRHLLLSLLLVCALISSTMLLYYSSNVSPDAAALGLVLIAWYYFFQYLNEHRGRHFYLFLLFGVLAGLIKVIMAMCFCVVLCLLLLEKMRFFKNREGTLLFPEKGKTVVSILIAFAVIASWYVYCKVLTAVYGNSPSLMQTMMVTDGEMLAQVWKYAKNFIPDYYAYEGYVLLVCALVIVLAGMRWANRMLLAITLCYLLGSLCYIYLFLYQFMHHDYYVIAMLPTVFFLFLIFFDMIRRLATRYSQLILGAFVIIMVFNLKESLVKTRKRYAERYDAKVYYSGDFKSYYDLGPRLRGLGIRWQDKVAVAFDNTFSASLYFMDQAGYTLGTESNPEMIRQIIERPDVNYLVLSDSSKFNALYPNDFAKRIVMYHRGLIVYKLK